MSRRRTRLGALALAAALLVAGCGGGSADSASSAGAEPAVEGGAAAAGDGSVTGQRAAEAVPDQASSSSSALGDPAAAQRQVVRTGQITIEVDTLATSAARVRQAALDARGYVASETTGYGQPADPLPRPAEDQATATPAGRGESVIVLRVPEARFAAVLDALAGIGTELSRSTTAEDVTGQVADLTSRTATAKASVDRVRALLADAQDLKDIVLLESELTRREADLEAYQAQLAALSGQAEMSTITAVLRTPQAAAQEPNAFLRGLQRGWEALQDSAESLFVLIGALLPFALLIALVGLPVWALLRRRRRTTTPQPSPAPPTAAPPPAGPTRPDGPDSGPAGPTPGGPPTPPPAGRDPVPTESRG